MTVLDLLNQPWAITPQKLEAMCEVYDRHAAGSKLDESAIQAATGGRASSSDEDDEPYTIDNGVAIIPVCGILAKKMNIFMQFSGGMSTQMLVDAVAQANADPLVHSLLLAVESPGGEVDGTIQIGDAVAQSAKPTAAWIDGMAASAAYWIASQCDSIYASSDTAQVGSVGVIVKHTDMSKANDAQGRKVTYITSGKFKSLGNSDQPLSDDGKDHMQGRIDYLATLFTSAVATGREIDPEQVWASVGDARMCFAQEALALDLIDGIASQDEVVSMLATAYSDTFSSGAQASASGNTKVGGGSMFKTFATEAEYNAHIAAVSEQAVNTARAESATTERNRIKAVQDQQLSAAHKDLIATLAFDGKTTGPEAAVAVLAAERRIAATTAANLEADAKEVKPIPASQPGTAAEEEAQAKARRDAVVAASGGGKPDEKINAADPHTTAAAITDYVDAQKAKGKTISFSEAAAAISAKK